MSEAHTVDWRKEENQQPVRAALKDARDLVIELEASGQLALMTAKVFLGLVQTAHFSYDNLVSGTVTESISFMAWSARILLEAEIWMQYVTASKNNVKRFHNDWLNDASELLDCSVSASELDAEQLAAMKALYGPALIESSAERMAEAEAMLAESRKSAGFGDEDFLRVSALARELGRGEWFGKYNKILSKYVHATAFSTLSFPSEKSRTNTSYMMLYEGTNSCLRLLDSLNTYFKEHTLRPIF